MTDDADRRPHEVTFSRYESDVLTRKRTLVHGRFVLNTTFYAGPHRQTDQEQLDLMSEADGLVPDAGPTADAMRYFHRRMVATEQFRVGDRIVFLNKEWSLGGLPARVMFGTLIRVSLGPLDVTSDDLSKLNADSAAIYVDRWNKLFPMLPAATRPIVWRLEWVYGALQAEFEIGRIAQSVAMRDNATSEIVSALRISEESDSTQKP